MFLIIARITKAATGAIDALKVMRHGAAAGVKRKRLKQEMSRLFNKKVKTVWRHKFVCLAYRDQERIPTTDCDKEELYQAGLGEKEIIFENLEISQSEFRDIILENFPRLEAGGGFRFLKGFLCKHSSTNNLVGLGTDYVRCMGTCGKVKKI